MNTLDQEIKGLQIAIDILADALKKRNRLATELQKARERREAELQETRDNWEAELQETRERAYPHNITTVEVPPDPRPYPCAEVEE